MFIHYRHRYRQISPIDVLVSYTPSPILNEAHPGHNQ
jgi:hypothetical protein